ncbi:hypothetical protein SORBI_3001G244000 [Sorghum bicolor]|uniref:Uncharacterized protein n=1 Tax=Sorghum bicolor TaxID=4558 RepID=A0A1Z5S746_SORBI|nr:hypothetical protein SORBI_3001G244000 [Sorghum bicolor]OQU91757.1 hypothetical protein SORBI_3001G244000 [Sorghum bicolor]OQU91758.1 hypothetical protein SORBI_3001G244000 [Sorghum bicolor]
MARARVPAPAMLVALLALAMAADGAGASAGADNGATICDTAKCGKGTCSEVPGIIPLLTSSYKCTCDPGWYQQMLSNLTVLNFAPCIIPDCTKKENLDPNT